MNNEYISGSFNPIQNFFLILLFFFVILIIFFCGKNYLNKEKHISFYYKEVEISNMSNKNIQDNLKDFLVSNKNIYGLLASLELAKFYVAKNQLDDALKILNMSKKYSVDSNFFNLITFKIAQIQFQKNYMKKAINTIDGILDDSWNSLKNNLKDDIYFQLNNKK